MYNNSKQVFVMKLFYIQETDKIKCAHRGLYSAKCTVCAVAGCYFPALNCRNKTEEHLPGGNK